MKQRNLSIDAIKGFAILLVMFGHVLVHNQMEDPYVYDFIKAVQMPLFMIVSGYLCGQGRRITDRGMYQKVLKKRSVAYLVPFFTWLIVQHPDAPLTACQTALVQLDYGLWFLAVLWILTWMVSTAQLISARFYAKNKPAGELIFWGSYGAFCLILLGQLIVGNTLLSPNLTILYVPFYMLGYVAGAYGKKYLAACAKSRWIRGGVLAAGILFLSLVVVKDLNSMETRTELLTQQLASVLGCAVIIYGICQLRDGRLKKILAWIGNYTLEIYVIHYHFARILNFHNTSYELFTWSGGCFAAAGFLTMCAATVCTIWLMKQVPLLDLLFFGKKRPAKP